jgi:hypothetical protein
LQAEARKGTKESSPIRVIEEPCFIKTTPTAMPYLPFHNGSMVQSTIDHHRPQSTSFQSRMSILKEELTTLFPSNKPYKIMD